jgi:hypothetical protein
MNVPALSSLPAAVMMDMVNPVLGLPRKLDG